MASFHKALLKNTNELYEPQPLFHIYITCTLGPSLITFVLIQTSPYSQENTEDKSSCDDVARTPSLKPFTID